MAAIKQSSIAILIAVLVAFTQLARAADGDARTHVGDVLRVQEQALAVFQERGRPLSDKAPVLFEDLLRTGRDARLKASLADGTELTLGENAELLVDDFVYEPDGTEGVLSIKVLKGAFLFVGGKIEEKAVSRVSIETSFGVLGVRGTTVWGGPLDSGWGVLVLDGMVTVTTDKGSVTVHAGQGTMIYEDGLPPYRPSPWSKAKTGRAVATISFRD